MLRILAVDDTPAVLRLAVRALKRAGHQVTAARSGSEALDAAHESPFDVAVVDYSMPPPNGAEVLASLREIHPNCVSILVSGALDVPGVSDAVNRGEVSRVLAKPYDGDALARTVSEAVESRHRISASYFANATANDRAEREALDKCLDGDYLQLALQPIVRASDRSVAAHEALLRSSHSAFPGPLDVLRAAERHGMIAQLGELVVSRAADRLRQLPDDVRLFINLHPEELADPDALQRRMQPLVPYAHRVVLEITERSKMTDVHAWERSVQLVAEAGISLAVDDLGAGYSSLSALAQLKPQFMKVDRSIITGIDADLHKRRLLELLCQFGRATGAPIIAEGIEEEAEASTIVECGADLLQGYLFGKPRL